MKHFVRTLMAFVVALVEVILICELINLIYHPGDQIFEFFFHRSFVQFLTLYVFALTATLLIYRTVLHVRARMQFRTSEKRKESWEVQPSFLSDQLNAVRKHLKEKGGKAALSCAKGLANEQKERVKKAYEVIHFLVGTLPALGLFGTVLGLSQSLFIAFSKGASGPGAVAQFVTALATALDTTVLGLVCAMFVGGFSWLLERLENQLGEEHAKLIRTKFSLDVVIPQGGNDHAGVSSHDPYSSVTETFRAELRALTSEILSEAKSTFEEILLDASRSFRLLIDGAVKEVWKEQREHDEAMVEKVASQISDRLGKSVDRIGNLIEKSDSRLTKDLMSQLKKLEETLRKKNHPAEVIIRYEKDGNVEKEANNGRA